MTPNSVPVSLSLKFVLKLNQIPNVTFKELSGPLRTMQEMARKIAQNSRDAKIEVDVEDYVAKFKPFMMDVVFEWCKGATFSEVLKMTDLFEGLCFIATT